MDRPRLQRPDEPIPIGDGFAMRPWRCDDASTLVPILNGDADISRWESNIPQPYDVDDAYAFIDLANRSWDDGTSASFAIVGPQDVVVGSVDLYLLQEGGPSISYWIARSARGRGLAVAAASAVTEWAFATIALDKVVLFAQPSNAASRAVAARAGFSEAGTRTLVDGIERVVYERRREDI